MEPLTTAALIGGGASLLSSILGAYGASQEREEAAARRRAANKSISDWQNQAERILAEAEAGNVSLSSPQDLEAYRQMRAGYDPSKYVYTGYEPFNKDSYNVEDYLNPAKDAILADIAKTTQHTAAGAGLGHSSGALEAISQNVMGKSEELYDKAFDRMTSERNFDYGMFTDYINQKQKELDALQQGTLNRMNFLREDLTFDQQQRDAMTGNRLSLGNALAQARASLV